MATVVIVLPPGQPAAARSKALRRITQRLARSGRGPAEPTFPGSADEDLGRFLHVETTADDAAELAAELAALTGVDGAYVKPADEAP